MSAPCIHGCTGGLVIDKVETRRMRRLFAGAVVYAECACAAYRKQLEVRSEFPDPAAVGKRPTPLNTKEKRSC